MQAKSRTASRSPSWPSTEARLAGAFSTMSVDGGKAILRIGTLQGALRLTAISPTYAVFPNLYYCSVSRLALALVSLGLGLCVPTLGSESESACPASDRSNACMLFDQNDGPRCDQMLSLTCCIFNNGPKHKRDFS